MKFSQILLSALLLAAPSLVSAARARPRPRAARQAGAPPARPALRPDPAERRKAPIFPKMEANFVVAERAAPTSHTVNMADRRKNALLPKLELKMKIVADSARARGTPGHFNTGVEPFRKRIPAASTLDTTLPSGVSSNKMPLMKPSSGLEPTKPKMMSSARVASTLSLKAKPMTAFKPLGLFSTKSFTGGMRPGMIPSTIKPITTAAIGLKPLAGMMTTSQRTISSSPTTENTDADGASEQMMEMEKDSGEEVAELEVVAEGAAAAAAAAQEGGARTKQTT